MSRVQPDSFEAMNDASEQESERAVGGAVTPCRNAKKRIRIALRAHGFGALAGKLYELRVGEETFKEKTPEKAGHPTGPLSALAYLKEAAAKRQLTSETLNAARQHMRRVEREPDLLFVPPLENTG